MKNIIDRITMVACIIDGCRNVEIYVVVSMMIMCHDNFIFFIVEYDERRSGLPSVTLVMEYGQDQDQYQYQISNVPLVINMTTI